MGKEAEKQPRSPFRILLDKIVFTLYVIGIVSAFCFSSFVWFQKTYFDSYWVNGQSMWPTLNPEARDVNGVLFNEERLGLDNATGIDFIIADKNPIILNKLERFDIIVCKYSDNDTYDKIKRIIVMPGETFYFDSTNDINNGTLHLLDKTTNEFKVIEQPIGKEYISRGDYSDYSTPTTLPKDKYFVLGDNRAKSSDSRQNGPVSKSNIDAKAIALVARCKIVYNVSSGKYIPKNIDYMWPRFF